MCIVEVHVDMYVPPPPSPFPPHPSPLPYDTKVRGFTSRPCGGVVIGKVWQVHMLGSIPVYDMYHFGLGQG